ncbi:MAG: ATP-binding protein [Clostridiales bacterium]|nr:ATP-binding protein [Clostridiales bacterium]
MTRQEAVILAEKYFDKLKNEREELIDQRENEIRESIPEIDALLKERAALPVMSLKQALLEPAKAGEISGEMIASGRELNTRIRSELVKHGFKEDWLAPSYKCAECRDTGYIYGSIPAKACKCFEDKVNELMLQDLGANEDSFERFDAGMIPDEPIAPELTQRQLAVRVMQACKDWVNDYPNCYKPGIVLQGQTGLGKTFLLNCIEKGLREKGVYTLKLTSYQMLENMRSKHFHLENSDEVFDEMLSCPVLLIDDLGSEPMLNNISKEYLYVLLNERMGRKLKTVIATNLTQPQIKELYQERIMSRLSDKAYWDRLVLQGKDLRRA